MRTLLCWVVLLCGFACSSSEPDPATGHPSSNPGGAAGASDAGGHDGGAAGIESDGASGAGGVGGAPGTGAGAGTGGTESCDQCPVAGGSRCSGGDLIQTCAAQGDGCLDWVDVDRCVDSGICELGEAGVAVCAALPTNSDLFDWMLEPRDRNDHGLWLNVTCRDDIWTLSSELNPTWQVPGRVDAWVLDLNTWEWVRGWEMEPGAGENEWTLDVGRPIAGFGCDEGLEVAFVAIGTQGRTLLLHAVAPATYGEARGRGFGPGEGEGNTWLFTLLLWPGARVDSGRLVVRDLFADEVVTEAPLLRLTDGEWNATVDFSPETGLDTQWSSFLFGLRDGVVVATEAF